MTFYFNFIKKKFLVMMVVFSILAYPALISSVPQEARVNKHKVEKERIRREKANDKKYHDAVKRHEKNQSKATRDMMKQSRKDARKHTPVTPKKGKCR